MLYQIVFCVSVFRNLSWYWKKIIALLHTLSARAVALDTSKTFDRVWHASLLHKRRSYGISGQIFGLISSFLSNRQLRVVLDGKSLQEYLVNAGVPQGSILGLTLLSFIYTFLSVILLSLLMILPSTLNMIWHLNCGNNYNWLLNVNLICEKLWTRAGNGLLISMLEKLNWFCLTGLITLVLLMWK